MKTKTKQLKPTQPKPKVQPPIDPRVFDLFRELDRMVLTW